MSVPQVVLRVIAGVAGTVAAGVAVNQVLDNDGTWNWTAAVIAVAIAVAATLLSLWLDHRKAPQSPGATEAPQQPATARRVTRHRYLRRVRLEMAQMETIGLVTHADLILQTRQVYVEVALQLRAVTSAAAPQGNGPTPQMADKAVGRRAPLASFLHAGCVLVVLGAAGSGKTTLARFAALELAERRHRPWQRAFWQHRRIPVLLYLRDHGQAILADEPPTLAEAAAAAPWLRYMTPARWLERLLGRGRCVVLLDGLDETADADDRKGVVTWLENQVRRYPGNSFVITSRPLGYGSNRLTHADVLQVQQFSSRQIHAFLHAWYRGIDRRAYQGDRGEIDRRAAQTADALLHLISARPALRELAANPLLLTMIATVHRYRGQLPGSRAGLYEEMCQVLLYRRQDAKRLTRADELSGEKKERIVQELAWYMMRKHLRDIPIEEANRAIQTIMGRTASDLSAHAFLTQVHASGLLVEREHQRYGFAHLTLQEYLAAALAPSHHSRQQVLTDHVKDPWWRETILLWAARADASPVVEACLRSPTVTALHLAYACADEALELDLGLRRQLDQLLTTTPADPESARLLDGVAAARALHDTRTLDEDGTLICVNPISIDLWNRYTKQTSAPAPREGLEADPATGLWPAEIRAFVSWLNSLLTDGTRYRLPTAQEARRALAADLYPHATLWAWDGPDMKLIVPGAEAHPHRPPSASLRGYPQIMIHHLQTLFRLLLPQSTFTFGQLITYARSHDRKQAEHRLLQILDLLLAINLARELTAFRLDEALGNRLDLGGIRERALALARIRAHQLNLDIAVDLTPGTGHIPDFDRAVNLARGLAVDPLLLLNQARSLNLDRARAFDLAFDGNLDSAFDLALTLAFDVDHDLRRAYVSQVGNLDRALATALDRDIDPIHRPHVSDLDFGLGIALDHDLQAAHDLGIDLPDILFHHLARNRDLAFARALAFGDMGGLEAAVMLRLSRACRILGKLANRPAGPGQKPRRRRVEEAAPFSAILRTTLMTQLGGWSPVADDPQTALSQAFNAAKALGFAEAASLIGNAQSLATPIWERHRPVRQSDFVLAVTCIMAALADMTTSPNVAHLSSSLRSVLNTLIALTPDMTSDSALPKKVVLVRG
ncbi:NACHT domain-containing protein [Nonomuraea sp. NBC_01738]|uniref:NACHT domain-containing protein n=1 Tax=Nonomuraea sp. NBC_01738 TaxID=2976003 RepID=UPI002E0F6BD7|nr:NACHT domain-containing protein [Nonomuraea sp. NBC_01738]